MKTLFTYSFILLSLIGYSQTFAEITGAANPLNGEDVGEESDPSFADLDGDGDLDMISGENDGHFNYYENTGTPTAPIFVQRTGGANPMDGENTGDDNKMELIDIDGDGDYDIINGGDNGKVYYFENTGTTTAPAFTQRTGGANPMNGVDIGDDSNPSFADLDNDGDYDLVLGEDDGTMYWYENTGTATAPVYTNRTGASNPMNGIDVGKEAAPAFVDMDADGDLDLFVADDGASFSYFENTGTVSAPVFVERTGAANPLDGFTPDTAPTLTYVDIDGDGDSDQFSGGDNGKFKFYRGDGTGGNPSDRACNPCYSRLDGEFGASLTWSNTSGGLPVTGTPPNDGTEYIVENGIKVTVDADYSVKNIIVGNGTGTGELEWSGDHSLTFF